MTEPQPEPEYIITEMQLKDMVENGTVGWSPYRAGVADKVRSRPATSAEQVLEELDEWIDGNEDLFAWIDDTFHRRHFVSGLGELKKRIAEFRQRGERENK